MKHNIFTIHDKAAGAYLPPFILHAEGIAIRTFTDCINDTNHAFSKHPADYTLLMIGTFDDMNGDITKLQTHKPLGNGLSFVVKTEHQPDLLSQLNEDK